MDNLKKIDLSKTESKQTISSNQKKKKWGKGKFIGILLGIILILGLIWIFNSSSSSSFNFNLPVFSKSFLNSTDGKVNILLLGNAGGKHDGPSLTDSIIVASYNLKTKKAVLVSIPRDLWVEDTKSKVNAIYENGPSGNKLGNAKDKIGQIVGLPIHYAIRLDFAGFEKALDLVEGIDVEVAKTFDDYNYPIEGKENDLCGLIEKEVELTEEQAKPLNLKSGKQKVLVNTEDKIATTSADFACRFEHIHFDKGLTNMNGETALKFVRSRQGTNGEGSDFARSKRQQLVLQAFREKALSLETLFNPQKIGGLISTFGDSFETDIPATAYLEVFDLTKNLDATESIVLGDLGGGKSVFVVGSSSKYGGWVLVPPNDDFTPVKELVKNRLEAIATQSANPK